MTIRIASHSRIDTHLSSTLSSVTRGLTKVLMDGGSGLNIMYTETLDAMGISQTQLRLSRAPFHSIVLGKRALPSCHLWGSVQL
jgi:hypothetical protein